MEHKQCLDLAQNIYVLFTNAINTAQSGGDYGPDWEQAMRDQGELLRLINEMKYKAQTKVKREIPTHRSQDSD